MMGRAGDRPLNQESTSGIEEVVMKYQGDTLADEMTETFGKKTVKLSHLNKLYWEKEGIRKGALIAYYRDMAGYILPYLKDKPLSLKRQPNGTKDEGFFQKDVDPELLPAWAKTTLIHSESNDKDIHYLVCNDAATLLFMINMGCIEIDPWLSSYKKPEQPDFMVLDLDPNDVPFSQTIETALKAKEVFDRLGLDAYIKTSGSRGLHIYCYLGAKYQYELTRTLMGQIATLIHSELPAITSIERNPAKRPNKIYLDFLQNSRGQTVAAPYSVRPRPGATVSAPLAWEEVNDSLKAADHTIFTMPGRVKNKSDPWKNLFSKKADLRKAMALLK